MAGLELLLLATVLVLSLVVGLQALEVKILHELVDLGTAVGSLDQTYSYSGIAVFHPNSVHDADNPLASWSGSDFQDGPDFCDDGGIQFAISIPHTLPPALPPTPVRP